MNSPSIHLWKCENPKCPSHRDKSGSIHRADLGFEYVQLVAIDINGNVVSRAGVYRCRYCGREVDFGR
jgi:aspartate carbamoyltransferase regulatory subunit